MNLVWRMGVFLLLVLQNYITAYGQSVEFIPNAGQWNDPGKYRLETDGGTMFLTDDGFVVHLKDFRELYALHAKPVLTEKNKNFTIKGHVYKMTLKNSLAVPQWKHSNPTSNYYNYYVGNDPNRWKSKIFGYKEVQISNVYQNIDMKYYSVNGQLKYDFNVKAGAGAENIQMEYTGHQKLSINRKGYLVIETSLGNVMEMTPFAWQTVNGKVKEVPCVFQINGNIVSFGFPSGYSKNATLTIDPTLIFSTSSGSFADNFGMTATYDLQGNLFSGGTVFGNGFPYTTGAYDSTFAGIPAQGITDVIITKYNATGTSQIYSTYIGGLQCETVHSLIVNQQDELFFFGCTSSADFPMAAQAYNNSFGGGTAYNSVANGTNFVAGTDIYVAKLSADGTALLGSTFIGGTANDGINYPNSLAYDSLQFNYGDQFRGEVMVDDLGNCYIATCTKSADFPIVNGFGTNLNGGQAGVVCKFNQDLSVLEWSTFLNGQNKDAAYSLKVNDNYEVYVTGGTTSPNFPVTAGAHQTAFAGGKVDGFVAHLSNDGSTLLASTLIGTPQYDQSYFVELDRFGRVHIVGQTLGMGVFPVTSGVYSNANSGQFITSFNAGLSAINYSTLFGNGNGQVNISPAAFLVDVCGNIYVSGWGANILQSTPLSGMPVTSDAIFSTPPSGFDFYLIVLEKNATGILYGSYFGGNQSREHVDGGTSRFDPNGIVYQSVCAGCGGYDDFPSTPGAWSPVNNSSNCNNGVFKFDFEIIPQADFTVSTLEGCAPLSVTFTNNSINNTNFLWDFGNNDTTSIIVSPSKVFPSPGTYNVYLYIEDTACLLTDTALQVVTVYPELQITASTDTTWICQPGIVSLTATASGHNGNFIWSSTATFSDTLNSNLSDSTLTTVPGAPGWYYVMVSNPGCKLYDSVYVAFTSTQIQLDSIFNVCEGSQIDIVLQVNTHTANPVTSYNWQPDSIITSGDGTATVTLLPNVSQWLYVDITTALGCTYQDSAMVNVIGIGTTINAWTLQDSVLLGTGTLAQVSPTGLSYTWLPADGVSNPASDSTDITPLQPGWNTYTVTVGTGNCLQTDTVRIFAYEFVCGPPYVFVPNAFTPDLNGLNEKFKVYGRHISEITLRVFDRWGELMFETHDPLTGWDGTYKGRPCDPAVYVYYFDALCIDGQTYFEKGNVTLIR